MWRCCQPRAYLIPVPTGFVVFDYAKEYKVARRRMASWIVAGKLKYAVEEMAGLDRWIDALDALFSGANTGKVALAMLPLAVSTGVSHREDGASAGRVREASR